MLPEDHINEKMSACALLANMRVVFSYVDEEMVKKKIKTSFIRPTLEYASVV